MRKFLFPALIVIILGYAYYSTLLPGIPGMSETSLDSAKFQFIGKVWGTTLTGYPLYIVLNHYFTAFFPWGTLAYKANLLSAVFSIIAVLYLYRTMLILKCGRVVSFVTALTFGFTYTLWSQSIVAEVYTLNILFVAMVIYYFLEWRETKNYNSFYLACFLYALSFGNHLTMITLLPAIIYFVWKTDRKFFTDVKKISIVATFILIGALQYGYHFWRYYSPENSYLEMQTPDLATLWSYVTGGQFKPYMFTFEFSSFLFERVPLFFRFVLHEYLFLTLISIWGFFTFKNNTVRIFLMLIALGTLVFSLNYDIFDILVYFIPAYLILAVFLGLGLQNIMDSFEKRYQKVIIAILFLIPLLLITNWTKVDKSGDTSSAMEIEKMIELIKQDAIIVPDSYHSEISMNYYLLGEDIGRERNLYVADTFAGKISDDKRFQGVLDYLLYEKPLYIPSQRRWIQPGLEVYFVGVNLRGSFESEGLISERIANNIYLIKKAPKP